MSETNASELPPLYVATLESNVDLPSPQQFYDCYVQPRRPVLIRQQIGAVLHNPHILTELNSAEKLLELVGSEHSQTMVEVNVASSSCAQRRKSNEKATATGPDADQEPESSSTASPSTSCLFSPQHGSRVVQMSLAELCSRLKAGSTEYYMTTQTLPVDEEGRPAVYNWLTKRLIQKGVLPVRPALLGHLIPMNVANVWMGRTETVDDSKEKNTSNHEPIRSVASSSGLHHDMHDNLYCLLLGKKTLRVAPPSTVQSCKMVGRLHTLHENGRIVYYEQLEREDQFDNQNPECPIRPDGALLLVERIVQLEIQKEAIERQLCAMEDTDDRKPERESLEEELDLIQEELLDIEMSENESEDSDSDEDDSHDDPGALFGSSGRAGLVSLEEPNAKRAKLIAGSLSTENEIGIKRGRCAVRQPASTIPPNFVVEESKDMKFQTLHLEAGDALYLPAGWFHEVYSVGESVSGLHIAINYWVHPPDVGRCTGFEQPYRSMFWQRDWDARSLYVDCKPIDGSRF